MLGMSEMQMQALAGLSDGSGVSKGKQAVEVKSPRITLSPAHDDTGTQNQAHDETSLNMLNDL